MEKAKKLIKIRFDFQIFFSDFAYTFIILACANVMLVSPTQKGMLALDKPSPLWFLFLNNFFNSRQPNFTYHSPKRYNILKARKPKGEIIYNKKTEIIMVIIITYYFILSTFSKENKRKKQR